MSIKVGDRVKFLDDEGGGTVVKIINDKQAMVQTSDGFDVPSLISQLVKTESGGEVQKKPVFTQANKVVETKPTKNVEIKEAFNSNKIPLAKILLAFVPENGRLAPEVTVFNVYLLNDGDYFCTYTFAQKCNSYLNLIEKGTLEPETKVHIGKFSYIEMLKIDCFVIDLLYYNEDSYKQQLPLHFELMHKDIPFLKEQNYKENDFFYDNAFIIEVANKLKNEAYIGLEKKSIEKVIKEKELQDKPKVVLAKINSEIEEVDLHIEEIVESTSGLTPGEIINIQLSRFTTTLEGAIKNNTKRIVFIHGSGSGKLRYEIQKLLKQNYTHLEYQDASYAEYGFGATMVIVKK